MDGNGDSDEVGRQAWRFSKNTNMNWLDAVMRGPSFWSRGVEFLCAKSH